MQWLSDLVSKFNYADKGFSFKVTTDGLQVVLDLPLPDVQGGAFGLANLRLGFFFELSAVGGFSIAAGLLTPVGTILITAVMTTAIATVHFRNGIWNADGGFEFNLTLVACG